MRSNQFSRRLQRSTRFKWVSVTVITDSPDLVRFRGDYKLGTSSNGIDPTTEPVTIMLSTPAGGQFYPSPNLRHLEFANPTEISGSGFAYKSPLPTARRLLDWVY